MGQDKKQLGKLLQFVKELYDHPDNTEFTNGIRQMVLADVEFQKLLKESPLFQMEDPDAVKRMEKYLSLDYRIDEETFPDYSVIKDDVVRERLMSDFREMLRYEFGTRSHKIDFPEFCRFAVLQIEMLVNYFFEKKFAGDIDKIVAEIQSLNASYSPYSGLSQVSEIPLKTKLYHIRNVFGWSRNDINEYLFAADVRNKQSHRSLMVDKDMIRDVEDRLKAAGAWNEKSGKPNYSKNEDGVSKAVAAVGQDTLNEYQFQVWCDSQPFSSVTQAIKKLTEAVAKNI